MASFFVECEELLEALLDALQLMAEGESDVETINVAFRSVHSIKGGAGAFGLDDLVSFAHQFETVMDQCRDGTLDIDAKLNDLFFRCCDNLSDLVRCSRDDEANDAETTAKLIEELGTYADEDAEAKDAEPIEFQPMTLDLDDFGPSDGADLPDLDAPLALDDVSTPSESGLIITFKPEPELYESGNEPFFLLQSLSDLGPCSFKIDFTPPESLEDFSTLGNRLSWTIEVETNEGPSIAHEVFEFADGLCKLDVQKGQVEKKSNPKLDVVAVEEAPQESEPAPDSEPEPVSLQEQTAEKAERKQPCQMHQRRQAKQKLLERPQKLRPQSGSTLSGSNGLLT